MVTTDKATSMSLYHLHYQMSKQNRGGNFMYSFKFDDTISQQAQQVFMAPSLDNNPENPQEKPQDVGRDIQTSPI